MKIYIKDKFSSEWRRLYKVFFELYDDELFVYNDLLAINEGEVLPDCTLQFEIDKQCIQFDVRDGCLQNLENMAQSSNE